MFQPKGAPGNRAYQNAPQYLLCLLQPRRTNKPLHSYFSHLLHVLHATRVRAYLKGLQVTIPQCHACQSAPQHPPCTPAAATCRKQHTGGGGSGPDQTAAALGPLLHPKQAARLSTHCLAADLTPLHCLRSQEVSDFVLNNQKGQIQSNMGDVSGGGRGVCKEARVGKEKGGGTRGSNACQTAAV